MVFKLYSVEAQRSARGHQPKGYREFETSGTDQQQTITRVLPS